MSCKIRNDNENIITSTDLVEARINAIEYVIALNRGNLPSVISSTSLEKCSNIEKYFIIYLCHIESENDELIRRSRLFMSIIIEDRI